MRLGDLVVRFVADMGGWNTGVKQAQTDMDDTGKTASKMDTSVKRASADFLIMAGTAAAAGYAVYAAAQKFGGAAQNLKDLSYQTGLATRDIQQLQYGAMLSGTEFGKVSLALNNVSLSMEAAKDATSEQARAFRTLGVDPTGKTPAIVFYEIMVAITNVKDESKRATLANQILGKSWKEILPFMSEYIANKEKINAYSGYTEEELKNQESLKVAFDESLHSADLFFGHWIANLGKVAKAQSEMEYSQPSYLDQWITNTFGNKSSGRSGAGGRSGSGGAGPGEPTTTGPLVDKYSGLSEEGLKYQISLDTLATAQKEYNLALTGTQEELDIAARRLREVQLSHEALRLEMAKSHTEDQIVALEGLQQALKDVGDEQTRLANLNRDYLEDVKYAGADVSQIRRITMAHQRDLRNEDTTMSGLKQKLSDSANAAGYGDLIINIDGKQLVKVKGVISGELNRQSATARGVRTAS